MRELIAFWHKSRQTFVPLLSSEVAPRIGRKQADTTLLLCRAQTDGLVVAEHVALGGPTTMVWSLTPRGEAKARKAIAEPRSEPLMALPAPLRVRMTANPQRACTGVSGGMR